MIVSRQIVNTQIRVYNRNKIAHFARLPHTKDIWSCKMMLLPLLNVLRTDNPRHKAKTYDGLQLHYPPKHLPTTMSAFEYHLKLHNNPLVSASFMLCELQWSPSRHRSDNVDSLSTSDPKWMVIHRTWVAMGVLHSKLFFEPPGICRGPTLTCRA